MVFTNCDHLEKLTKYKIGDTVRLIDGITCGTHWISNNDTLIVLDTDELVNGRYHYHVKQGSFSFYEAPENLRRVVNIGFEWEGDKFKGKIDDVTNVYIGYELRFEWYDDLSMWRAYCDNPKNKTGYSLIGDFTYDEKRKRHVFNPSINKLDYQDLRDLLAFTSLLDRSKAKESK